MRIPIGVHKGRDPADLAADEIRSTLDWIEEVDAGPDPWTPWQRKHQIGPLVTALSRALRDAEDDEEPLDEAETLAAELRGSAFMLLSALWHARAENKEQEPFSAPRERLQQMTGLSNEAFSRAKRVLMDKGLLLEPTRGDYRLFESRSETERKHMSLYSFLFLRTARNTKNQGLRSVSLCSVSDNLSPGHLDEVVSQAFRIVSADVSERDDEHRYARTRLRRLLDVGYAEEDVLDVVRWARRTYDTGENRHARCLDLTFLWTQPKFGGYLRAARSGPAKREYHVGGHEDQEDPETRKWNEDYLRKIKKRGLS